MKTLVYIKDMVLFASFCFVLDMRYGPLKQSTSFEFCAARSLGDANVPTVLSQRRVGREENRESTRPPGLKDNHCWLHRLTQTLTHTFAHTHDTGRRGPCFFPLVTIPRQRGGS